MDVVYGGVLLGLQATLWSKLVKLEQPWMGSELQSRKVGGILLLKEIILRSSPLCRINWRNPSFLMVP